MNVTSKSVCVRVWVAVSICSCSMWCNNLIIIYFVLCTIGPTPRMYPVKQINLCTSCTMDCEPLDSNWAYEIYCWYILQKKPFKAVDLHKNSFQIPSSSSSLYCTYMSFHCWAIRVLGSSMVRLPAHENGGEFHSSIAKPVVPYFKFEFSYYLRA
jgi:hypothetical protein